VQLSSAAEATPFDDGAVYDLFFERLDLGLDFYLGPARPAGGPVLDVACGTGRIMLPCLKAGLDVEGLALSPAMLARLRQKASALGFEPKLHHSGMSGFRLSRRRICALGDSRRLRWPPALARDGCDDCPGLDRSRCMKLEKAVQPRMDTNEHETFNCRLQDE
jgi:SAM-dependent methyltransferase